MLCLITNFQINVEDAQQQANNTKEELIKYKELLDDVQNSLDDKLDDAEDMDAQLNKNVAQLNNKIIILSKEKEDAINECNKLNKAVRTFKVNLQIFIIKQDFHNFKKMILVQINNNENIFYPLRPM